MDLSESQLSLILSGLILVGFLLALPALTSAIAHVRAERALGKLFWHVVAAFDRHRRR